MLPIIFVRTLVGGEPEVLRGIAGVALLLSGVCLTSLAFDFAPDKAVAAPITTSVEVEPPVVEETSAKDEADSLRE